MNERSTTKRVAVFRVIVFYGPADDMPKESLAPEALRFAMQVGLVDHVKKRIPLDSNLRGVVVVQAADFPPLSFSPKSTVVSPEEYFRDLTGEELP